MSEKENFVRPLEMIKLEIRHAACEYQITLLHEKIAEFYAADEAASRDIEELGEEVGDLEHSISELEKESSEMKAELQKAQKHRDYYHEQMQSANRVIKMRSELFFDVIVPIIESLRSLDLSQNKKPLIELIKNIVEKAVAVELQNFTQDLGLANVEEFDGPRAQDLEKK